MSEHLSLLQHLHLAGKIPLRDKYYYIIFKSNNSLAMNLSLSWQTHSSGCCIMPLWKKGSIPVVVADDVGQRDECRFSDLLCDLSLPAR